MIEYNPQDHYWAIGGVTSEVYSSRRNIMVPESDAAYQAWSSVPLQSPDTGFAHSTTPIADVEALRAVLLPLGVLPEWLIVTIPTFIQPAEGTYSKEQLAEYSAHRRWQEEITGIVFEGKQLATDRKSQGLTTVARSYAVDTPAAVSIQYKTADGSFTTYTSAKMIELAEAMSAFVQSCFDTEAVVRANIVSASITTLEQIDQAYEPLVTREGRQDFGKLRRWRVDPLA